MAHSRIVAVVGACLGLAVGTLFSAQQPQVRLRTRAVEPAVQKDGWWIRINPEPKVEALTWRFSDPGKKDTEPESLTWARGSGTDNFDLPENLRLSSPLAFEVDAMPEKGAITFCVFYANQGVKLVTLPGPSKFTADSKQRDKGCTP